MGRFINEDSLISTGQGILGYNMFAYCLNNPVNMVDPSGEIAISKLILIGSIIAAIVVSGYVAYTSYECTGEVDVLNTIAAGVSTFMTCYSLCMSVYCMYLQFCQYKCYTPVYNLGGGTKGGKTSCIGNGKQYSVMYRANTGNGLSRSAHRNSANRQFYNQMKSSSEFKRSIDNYFGYDVMEYM